MHFYLVLGCRFLCVGVTKREVIHTNVITTLHVDGVVLRHGSVINLLRPVGVVVVHIIIVALGIIDQEADVIGSHLAADVRIGTEHLRGIQAILRSVHHIGQLRHGGDTYADVGIDTSGHRVTALGVDEDNTITTLGSAMTRMSAMSATTTSEPRTMAMVFFALRGFSASSVSTGTALRCAFGFEPGNASAAAALGAGVGGEQRE